MALAQRSEDLWQPTRSPVPPQGLLRSPLAAFSLPSFQNWRCMGRWWITAHCFLLRTVMTCHGLMTLFIIIIILLFLAGLKKNKNGMNVAL